MAVAFASALELQSALAGEAWPDDWKLLQQVDGIGRVYARKLFAAGLRDLNGLSRCEESRLEVVCGRNPPFGHKLRIQMQISFPQLHLNVDMQDDVLLCEGQISGKQESINFVVICQSEKESQILHHETFQREQNFLRSIKFSKTELHSISCSLIATAHSGCNHHVTFKLAGEKSTSALEPKSGLVQSSHLKPQNMAVECKTVPKIVPITQVLSDTPPAKRSVPSPMSSEKSTKSRHFLGNRNVTLASAQTFLQKYAPSSTPPIRSTLLLPKVSLQQTLIDEIEIELK
jgi:hypothetical protein